MITAKCIGKIRNASGTITHYDLQDKQGKILRLSSNETKQAIIQNKMHVINLKLTSNNRIIDNTFCLTHEHIEALDSYGNFEKNLSFKSNVNLDNIKNKASILGKTLNKIANNLYALCDKDNIIAVSDKQIALPVNSSGLFMGALFKSIDLSNIDTSNVKNMFRMFESCRTERLDLSNFNTSNVTSMVSMFRECETNVLDLSSFDTHNVKDMSTMFYGLITNKIDLSSFDTSKVENMCALFHNAEIEEIDLSNFNTQKVQNITYIFDSCKAKRIDISSFDTSNVKHMFNAFRNASINEIDISHFKLDKVESMDEMFKDCKAQRINIGTLKLLELDYKLKIFDGCNAFIDRK